MNLEFVRVVERGPRVDIILNRPRKRNALHPHMCDELVTAAEEAAGRPEVKCIVFKGEGPDFCAGFDVSSEQKSSNVKTSWRENRRMDAAMARIGALSVVTICELRGHVIGAGIILAANCNLRYAASDATFYVPELDVGLPFALGGVATLARYVGITRTAEMVLTANKVGADSPYLSGFVTGVVGATELSGRVDEIAMKITSRPQSLILGTVTQLREAAHALMPAPGTDLFAVLFADVEPETKALRDSYARKFRR